MIKKGNNTYFLEDKDNVFLKDKDLRYQNRKIYFSELNRSAEEIYKIYDEVRRGCKSVNHWRSILQRLPLHEFTLVLFVMENDETVQSVLRYRDPEYHELEPLTA